MKNFVLGRLHDLFLSFSRFLINHRRPIPGKVEVDIVVIYRPPRIWKTPISERPSPIDFNGVKRDLGGRTVERVCKTREEEEEEENTITFRLKCIVLA